MTIKKLTTLNFFLCITLVINAQQLNTKKLDSLFSLLTEKNKSMGSICVYKNDKVLYQNTIGYKKISGELKALANENTKYRIGSITKMFTATIVFQLIDEGKLNLNTKLSSFFPKVINAKKITIDQLLNHHSGLHNLTADSAYTTYNTQPKTKEQLLDIIYALQADFEPATKAEYSNTNYILLTFIIEKITGNTYAKEVEKRITAKLGLKNTYFGGKANVEKNEAFSYSFDGQEWKEEPETDMSIPQGAGAILSTAKDLTVFTDALFGGKLTTQASLQQMKTITHGFGRGCFAFYFNEYEAFGHTGGIDGFSSVAGRFGHDSLVVALVLNGENYHSNDIMKGVLNIVYNQPYQLPTFEKVVVNKEKLQSYVGTYTTKDFPLKISIMLQGNELYAQATGQGAFPLEAHSETLYKYDAAAIAIAFIVEDDGSVNAFNFSQGAAKFLFTKEK